MSPEEVLNRLGEDGAADDVALDWDRSMAALPSGVPDFLMPKAIIENRAWCGIGEDEDEVLVETARLIAQDEALRRLAWHCKGRLFDAAAPEGFKSLPTLERSLGQRSGAFYLLVGLSMVPYVRAHHRSLGLPESITRETCRQVRCFCEAYRLRHGGWPGIMPRLVNWLRHYPRELYFRIGRLEYWLRRNPCDPVVYRHGRSGHVVALARDGERFTREGYVDAPPLADAGSWTSTLVVACGAVAGHPISPDGFAVRRRVILPLSDWRRVLAPGDDVLQIHIPSGEGMTAEATRQSMCDAAAFFRGRFAGRSPVAFVSESWIFSNQLETLLPPSSNLVRYLRELYLFPIACGPNAGLSRIFPEKEFDLPPASRETRLQRALLDFLSAGNRWRAGGMFMMMDDVGRFGKQWYRSCWPPPAVCDEAGEG